MSGAADRAGGEQRPWRPPLIVSAALIGAALALLAYLATEGLGDAEGWRHHQQRYATLLRQSGERLLKLRIRALRPNAGATGEERCVSCHLGMALPVAFAERPFSRHPASGCALDVTRIGCVACHRGHPLALTITGAHGLTTDDPSRVLDWRAMPAGPRARRTARAREQARRRLQPGCATCHVERRRDGAVSYSVSAAPDVAAGQRLFVERGCFSCHRVSGVFAAAERGPALDTIGVQRPATAIRTRLLDPQQHTPRSAMPPTSLKGRALEQLVSFLVAQVGAAREPGTSRRAVLLASQRPASLLASVDAAVPARASEAAGARWATATGCRGCHRLDGERGGVPDLRIVGWYRRGAEELAAVLERPRETYPGTMMPALPLPKTARDSLVTFLLGQRRPLPSTPELLLERVCGPCHGAAGAAPDPKAVVLARRPPSLDRATITREALVKAVREGRPKTAMPPLGRVLGQRLLEGLHRALPARSSAERAPARASQGRKQ